MRKLVIIIEHLPPSGISSNSRKHFMAKANIIFEARKEAAYLAKAQWGSQRPMLRAIISYQFYYKVERHRDYDNLLTSCKPYQDGLKDAGVIVDDDTLHIQIGGMKAYKGTDDLTVITITELKRDMIIMENRNAKR